MRRVWKFKKGEDLNDFLDYFMDVFDYCLDGYGHAKWRGKYILEVVKEDESL